MSLIPRLDDTALFGLLAEHGDSFYVLDTGGYEQNLRELQALFAARYGRIGIGHSYKTNYIPQLCRAAYGLGAYAEVVSRMEFDMALRFGADPRRIIVNGPVKDDGLLRDALAAGSIVHIDGIEEGRRAWRILADGGAAKGRIGLRLNLPMEGRTRSRFGIGVEDPELHELLGAFRGLAACTVEGIHCHIGGDRTAASYAERTERMAAAAKELFPDAPPRYVDIGGGLAGRMPEALQQQLGYRVPSMADYAQAIAGTFARRFDASTGPELIVEPGIAVLSDALWFVCQVAAVKRIAGKHHAIVTGSIYNVKPTLHGFDLAFGAVPRDASLGEAAEWAVSGYTCMEIDVLHRGWNGKLATGDLLVFSNAGAYTVVLKPPFIKPMPAIVEVLPDGSTATVKIAEEVGDILRTYRW
jgi:diaminopimelate decarboxylase